MGAVALAVMVLAGLAGSVVGANGWAGLPRAATVVDPAVAAVVGRVDLERALQDARRLSGELPLCLGPDCETVANRVTGGQGVERAVDWLAAESSGMGFAVTVVPWKHGASAGRNVFARRGGVVTPTEEVWFVAHADGVSDCPGGRCPAADDNASGTVEGLELLRALADTPTARTVVVMFSTGEEQGMLGVSAWLATAPAADLARARALVNADMVAWDGDGDRVMEIYHGGEAPSIRLAESMAAVFAAYAPELRPRLNPGCG